MLNLKYFLLYTWKGYEKRNLQGYVDGTADLHYLNVQGDNSNAALLVINPVLEFHVARHWFFNLSASYFGRRTHYNYYYEKDLILREDNTVHAKTFEAKVGLTCRL